MSCISRTAVRRRCKLQKGSYRAYWFSGATGEKLDLAGRARGSGDTLDFPVPTGPERLGDPSPGQIGASEDCQPSLARRCGIACRFSGA